MTKIISRTALPLPGKEYNLEYMNRLVKQIELALSKITSVGPITCGSDLGNDAGHPVSGLTIVNVPTDISEPQNLPDWSVWCDTSAGNVLKIKLPS